MPPRRGSARDKDAISKAQVISSLCGIAALVELHWFSILTWNGTIELPYPWPQTLDFHAELSKLQKQQDLCSCCAPETRNLSLTTRLILAWPDATYILVDGIIQGNWGRGPDWIDRRDQHAGPDDYFIPEDEVRPLAQIAPIEREAYSGRARALSKLVPEILRLPTIS